MVGDNERGRAPVRKENELVIRLPYLPWQKEVRRSVLGKSDGSAKRRFDGKAKILVLACGARSGKDRVSTQLIFEIALRTALQRLEIERKTGMPALIPRVNIWVVAPNKRLLSQNWDEFKAWIPKPLILRENKEDGEIRIKGDIAFKFKSADDPEKLVSEGVDFLLVTEASRIGSGQAWEESLLPRLSSPGRVGIAFINGTPKVGKGHWYRKVWDKARKCKDGSMREWNLPSSCNPDMIPEIAHLRMQMPEKKFKYEIMAQWPDDDDMPFKPDDVDALVVDSGIKPEGPYYKGIDIARKHDATYITVWSYNGGVKQVVYAYKMKRKSLPNQIRQCCEIEERYPGFWVLDSTNNGGQFFLDAMKEALPSESKVFDYDFHGDRKVDLFDGLVMGVEQGQFVIRRDLVGDEITEDIVTQLKEFECEITDNGKADYHGPGGENDDGVTGLALGWVRLQFQKRVDSWDYQDMLEAQFG